MTARIWVMPMMPLCDSPRCEPRRRARAHALHPNRKTLSKSQAKLTPPSYHALGVRTSPIGTDALYHEK
eukprot:11217857-Lingulodinium_polyedra.AAC.1